MWRGEEGEGEGCGGVVTGFIANGHYRTGLTAHPGLRAVSSLLPN